jgi:hypothetical protein
MSFFLDDACMQSISAPAAASPSCATTPLGAASMTVAGPVPMGGACTASGGKLAAPPGSWAQVARACGASTAPVVADCGAGQVCAPAAVTPFSTQPCVMQAEVVTTCPLEYPAGPYVFYSGLDDTRACSPCACAAPSGGACGIASPAIAACITPPGGTWDASGACSSITGPEPVRLAASPTLDDAGACAVDGGTPSGATMPTGAVTFCCSQ